MPPIIKDAIFAGTKPVAHSYAPDAILDVLTSAPLDVSMLRATQVNFDGVVTKRKRSSLQIVADDVPQTSSQLCPLIPHAQPVSAVHFAAFQTNIVLVST